MGVDTGQHTDRHGEDRARAAVLEVTRAVLGEVGYQHLRVEAVAARAGVPRVWLRRWWTTRPLLVAEALQRMGGPSDIVPTGDLRADVRAVVLRTAAFLANPVVGDALMGLTGDAARDPVAAERLAALLAARRAGDTAVLLSAVARGDLRPDTDVPLLLDLLFGALLFRLGRGTPPTQGVVDALVDLVLHGWAAPVRQAVDGHAVDGQHRDGLRLDGPQLDGFGLDGQHRDGQHRDGFRPDGQGFDGQASDGQYRDGVRLDGRHRDGRHRDGYGVDGHGVDGHGEVGAGLPGAVDGQRRSARDAAARDGGA
jgi:AcrR family transcriptional regulator